MTPPRMEQTETEDSALVELGIERVRIEHFLWEGYRYTNMDDAIAAARRGKK